MGNTESPKPITQNAQFFSVVLGAGQGDVTVVNEELAAVVDLFEQPRVQFEPAFQFERADGNPIPDGKGPLTLEFEIEVQDGDFSPPAGPRHPKQPDAHSLIPFALKPERDDSKDFWNVTKKLEPDAVLRQGCIKLAGSQVPTGGAGNVTINENASQSFRRRLHIGHSCRVNAAVRDIGTGGRDAAQTVRLGSLTHSRAEIPLPAGATACSRRSED